MLVHRINGREIVNVKGGTVFSVEVPRHICDAYVVAIGSGLDIGCWNPSDGVCEHAYIHTIIARCPSPSPSDPRRLRQCNPRCVSDTIEQSDDTIDRRARVR